MITVSGRRMGRCTDSTHEPGRSVFQSQTCTCPAGGCFVLSMGSLVGILWAKTSIPWTRHVVLWFPLPVAPELAVPSVLPQERESVRHRCCQHPLPAQQGAWDRRVFCFQLVSQSWTLGNRLHTQQGLGWVFVKGGFSKVCWWRARLLACPWEMSQQLQTPRRGKDERAGRATTRTCPPPSGLGARQPGWHGEGPGHPVPPSESSAGAEPAGGQPRL